MSRPAILAALLALLVHSAAAQAVGPKLIIGGANFQPYPLAVAPFQPAPGGAEQTTEIYQTLIDDLAISGLFDPNVLNPKGYLADPREPMTVDGHPLPALDRRGSRGAREGPGEPGRRRRGRRVQALRRAGPPGAAPQDLQGRAGARATASPTASPTTWCSSSPRRRGRSSPRSSSSRTPAGRPSSSSFPTGTAATRGRSPRAAI